MWGESLKPRWMQDRVSGAPCNAGCRVTNSSATCAHHGRSVQGAQPGGHGLRPHPAWEGGTRWETRLVKTSGEKVSSGFLIGYFDISSLLLNYLSLLGGFDRLQPELKTKYATLVIESIFPFVLVSIRDASNHYLFHKFLLQFTMRIGRLCSIMSQL